MAYNLWQITTKVLFLLQKWGIQFEPDHDILPLFSDVYKALKQKGIEFPEPQQPAYKPEPTRPQQ